VELSPFLGIFDLEAFECFWVNHLDWIESSKVKSNLLELDREVERGMLESRIFLRKGRERRKSKWILYRYIAYWYCDLCHSITFLPITTANEKTTDHLTGSEDPYKHLS
jgi:hypothetical protein